MARRWKPRQAPPSTSITEIARRYYATAIALSKAMGLPMSEDFLRQHRESISCCFIEAGRAGVRLPSGVTLPPLTQAHEPLTSDLSANGQPVEPRSPDTPEMGEVICCLPPDPALEPSTTNGHTPPTVVPKDSGLPCGGVAIEALKPAQLAMLIVRAANLVHEQGAAWVPLLGSLQIERSRRLENGRKPRGEG